MKKIESKKKREKEAQREILKFLDKTHKIIKIPLVMHQKILKLLDISDMHKGSTLKFQRNMIIFYLENYMKFNPPNTLTRTHKTSEYDL